MLPYTYCPVQSFYFGLIVQQPHRTEKYDNNRSSSPTVISCWDFNWYFSFMSNTAEFCGHVLLMRARCHLWLQQYTKWESHSLGVNTTSTSVQYLQSSCREHIGQLSVGVDRWRCCWVMMRLLQNIAGITENWIQTRVVFFEDNATISRGHNK